MDMYDGTLTQIRTLCRAAETLCIHSVCVAQSERHQGVAATILKVYEMLMRGSEPQVKRIRLLCKEVGIPTIGGKNWGWRHGISHQSNGIESRQIVLYSLVGGCDCLYTCVVELEG